MEENKYKILTWVIVVAALGAGVYFFGFASQERSQTISSDKASLTHETETIAKQGPQARYSIEAHYPVFSGLATEKRDELNTALASFIEGEIAAYERETRELPPLTEPELTPGTFSADYTILIDSAKLISIRFSISSYMAGAAHPFSYATGFIYDLDTGRRVSLSDIFEPGSDYLGRLSAITRTHLLQARARAQETPGDQQQEQWIREGTQPKEQNFAEFALSPDALLIYFNPYQVAPYAAGIQEVRVPYQDIRGILSDTGPAAYLTAN